MRVVNTKKVKCMTNRARRRRKRGMFINWVLFIGLHLALYLFAYWLYDSGSLQEFLGQYNLRLQF